MYNTNTPSWNIIDDQRTSLFNMIATINFNLSSISSCTIQSHPNRAHTPRAVSQFNTTSEPISVTQQCKRRCDCYDMYNELVPYEEAWSWQKSIVEKRKALVEQNEDHSDTLIILQHHPVYTLGRGSSENNLKFDIKNPPHPLFRKTERGGEVTYHGPGQLIMYPILNLRYHKIDLNWYLRALEEVVIRVLVSTFSLKASRIDGLTGVWVGDQKLAAIGIGGSRWITYHGVSLNVSTDLSPFDRIVPCGIRDRRVGSIKTLVTGFQSADEPVTSSIYHADDYQLIDIAHISLLKEFSEFFQVELCDQPISILKCREEMLEQMIQKK